MNFFPDLVSFGANSFRKQNNDNKKELETLGVDTINIDNNVKKEISEVKQNTFSEDEFLQDLNTVKEDNNLDFDTAFNETLKYYKSKGYNIEGVNIDEELGITSEKDTPIQDISIQEDNQKEDIIDKGIETFNTVAETPGRIAAGAISETPEIVGNVAGFAADVADFFNPIDNIIESITGAEPGTTKFDLGGLADQFRKDGIETKEKLQEILGANPDDFRTSVGEIGAEIGTLLIPGGQELLVSKLGSGVSKIHGAKEKIKLVSKGLEKLKEKAPNAFKAIKGGITGAQFDVVDKGEITPTGVVTGAIAEPLFSKASKLLSGPRGEELKSEINSRLGKLITKFSPSKLSKKQIDSQIGGASKGFAIVRENNPDIIVKGDNAVGSFIDSVGNTKLKIGKELEKVRGVGGVDVSKNIDWINKMKNAFTNRNFRKKLTKEELKEFNALNKFNSKEVIGALEKSKNALIDKTKNNRLSIEELDNYIIGTNNKISSLYNNANKSSQMTGLLIDDAINSKLKNTLDETITKGSGEGELFRKLKSDYQSVRSVEDNLSKIYGQLLRKKGDSSLVNYTDAFVLSNLGEAILTGSPTQGAKQLLIQGIRKELGKKNDPNFIIEEIIKLIDKGLGKKELSKGLKTGIEKTGTALGVKGINKVQEILQ